MGREKAEALISSGTVAAKAVFITADGETVVTDGLVME